MLKDHRISIRSETGARTWTVCAPQKVIAIGMATALMGWTAYATMRTLDADAALAEAASRLVAERVVYEGRIAALTAEAEMLAADGRALATRQDRLTDALSVRHATLMDVAMARAAADLEIAHLRSELERAEAVRRQHQDRVAALNATIARIDAERTQAENAAADARSMTETLVTTMTSVISERDSALALVDGQDAHIASLDEALSAQRSRQDYLIASLEDAADTSQTTIGGMFAGTGLDMDAILQETLRDYSGRGGPIEDGENLGEAPDFTEPDTRMAALVDDIERLSLMRVAAERLPFGAPTNGARMTSGFGPRRDPMRRKYRSHNGIDFAAPRGTPIYTTADGVVSFSGRQSGYGIVVKIRHAFGFETVYAHLNKSRVKVGQRIGRGDRLGDMGSTGRSTGSHVHYEVRIDGKPVNPSKFIKAGNNVL